MNIKTKRNSVKTIRLNWLRAIIQDEQVEGVEAETDEDQTIVQPHWNVLWENIPQNARSPNIKSFLFLSYVISC